MATKTAQLYAAQNQSDPATMLAIQQQQQLAGPAHRKPTLEQRLQK